MAFWEEDAVPFDLAQGKPFDLAQDKPVATAQTPTDQVDIVDPVEAGTANQNFFEQDAIPVEPATTGGAFFEADAVPIPVEPTQPYSLSADVSAVPGEISRGTARGFTGISAGGGGILEAAAHGAAQIPHDVWANLKSKWYYPNGKWNPMLDALGVHEPKPEEQTAEIAQGGTAIGRGLERVSEAGEEWADKMGELRQAPGMAPEAKGPISKVAGIAGEAAPLVAGMVATRNPAIGAQLYAAIRGGEGYHNAKAAGLDDTSALGAAIAHGAGAYAGGRVNLENVFLKNSAVREAVAKFGFNKVAGWGVQYAKAAGLNVAVNEAQQVYDNAVRMGYDKDAKAFDGLMEAGVQALLFSSIHAPKSAAAAFRDANIKTVRQHLEQTYGAESVTPHGDNGFEVAHGDRRSVVEFVKSEGELGTRDVKAMAKSAQASHPKLWEEALKQSKGDVAAAETWIADKLTPPAQTRENAIIRDPATGAMVNVDTLVQLVAGKATIGDMSHEVLHQTAKLAGIRQEGDMLVDPVTGARIPEEQLANILKQGTNHPIAQKVRDAALGIVNIFRKNKQETPFQVATRLQRGILEEYRVGQEEKSGETTRTPEEAAALESQAQAAAAAFDKRALEPGGPVGIPILEGPKKSVTGLVDQFGRTIPGTENVPVRSKESGVRGQELKSQTPTSQGKAQDVTTQPGAAWQAETPNKEAKVSGTWKVVEAADLLTSDKPAYDKTLQPRNRNTVASQEQVASISRNPDPNRLLDSVTTDTGSPIVDQNGQVVSGNGRVIGLRQAYGGDRAARYREAVTQKAKSLGLPEAGLMKEPVLVREMTDSGGKTVTDIAELSNRNQIMQRSAAEQAEADGKMLVDSGVIDNFHPDATGSIRTSSNHEFLKAFVQGTGDTGLKDAKGGFTPEIEGRVRRAVLAAILGEHPEGRQIVQDAIERADDYGIKRQMDGIMAAGPELVKVGQGVYDIRPELAQAVRDLIEFRKQKAEGKMATIDDYLSQQEMFATGRTPASEAILRALDSKPTIKATREWIDKYSEQAGKIDTKTGDIFGEVPVSKEALLGKALRTKAEEVRYAVEKKKEEVDARAMMGGMKGEEAKPPELMTLEEKFAAIRAIQPNQRTDTDIQWANQYSKSKQKLEIPQEKTPTKVDSFLSGFSLMQRGKVNAALNLEMTKDGMPRSRQWIVEDMVAKGAVVIKHTKDGRRLQLPEGTFIEERRLTKTAMDYAEHLTATAQGKEAIEAMGPVKGKVKQPGEEVRYAVEKKKEEYPYPNVDRKRVRELGYTQDIREAGYITPNGKLIDLSGKREGGQSGTRSLDHREVGGIQGMQELMAEGNVRMDHNSGAIDIFASPTKAQEAVIERIIRDKNGEVIIDVQKGLGTKLHEGDRYNEMYARPDNAVSVQYDSGTNPRKILNDIREYFGGPEARYAVEEKREEYPFYSGLTRAVLNMPLRQTMPGDQMLNKIRGLQGVKTQEIEETGLGDWLMMQKQNGKNVTKEAAAVFLKANGVRVEAVEKGARTETTEDIARRLYGKDWTELTDEQRKEANRLSKQAEESQTKFSQYAPPGGVPGSYREVLIKLPAQIPDLSLIAKPKVFTELPEDYNYIHDSNAIPDRQWGITPNDQIHARPVTGNWWPSKNRALSDTLQYLNYVEQARYGKDMQAAQEIKGYTSPHWSEPNVLAHMLMDERRIPLDVLAKTQPELAARLEAEGKTEARALHMIEGQSDWHQRISAEGAKDPQRIKEIESEIDSLEKLSKEEWNVTKAADRQDKLEAELKRLQSISTPSAPFRGDAWKRLVIRKMLQQAADGGYDLLTWSTGADRAKQWGSERVEWRKEPITVRGIEMTTPQWTVAGSEQSGGTYQGQDIEQMARQRGVLLEEKGETIRTKNGLHELINRILRNPEAGKVDKLTDRIWDRMQTEPEGTSMPRKEFFEFLYDKSFVNEANDIVRKMDKGVKVGDVETPLTDRPEPLGAKGMPVHTIPITAAMKSSIESGQTYYAVEAKPGEEKRRFANPLVNPEARKFAEEQRATREAAGQPPRMTDVEIRAGADEVLKDKPGTWAALRRGELNMTEDASKMQAAKRLLDEKATAAIQTGDQAALTEAVEAYGRYEQAGSEMGRAFRERRDRTSLPPEEQNKAVILDKLLKPSKPVKKAIEDATTPAEKTRLAGEEAKRIKSTVRAVQIKTGLNPTRLSKQTLSDSATVSEIIRVLDTLTAPTSDKVFEYWRNSILSAPPTQVANIVGNTASITWDRTMQRTGEALVNLVVRDPKSAQLGELGPLWRSTLGAMGKAGRHAMVAFSTEQPVLEGHRIEETGLSIAGTKGRVIRTPQRLLLAMDEFAKTTVYDGEIAAQAYRTAKAEGLKGEGLRLRQEELRSNPTEQMVEAALEQARTLTFQEPLGSIGQKMLNIRHDTPGLRYILPFITTPTNILKMGLKQTPLGTLRLAKKALKGEYAGNKTALTHDVAQQLLAWAAFSAVGSLITDDDGEVRITGNRPPSKTPAGEKAMTEAKYPSQSIRIGGKWYSYSRIEPIATSLALMVDGWNTVRDDESKDIGAKMGNLFTSLKGTVRDKTFLSGLGDIIRAFEDDRSSGGVTRNITQFAASWVPNIGRTAMRAYDPEYRDMKLRKQDDETTLQRAGRIAKQAAQQAFPVPSNAPAVKRNWLGQPLEKTERLGPATDIVFRILVGTRIQEDKTGTDLPTTLNRYVWNYNKKATEIGLTDQWWPGAPSNEMTLPGRPGTDRKRYMTDEQFERFQIRRGELFQKMASHYRWDPDDPRQGGMRRMRHLYELATERTRNEIIRERLY